VPSVLSLANLVSRVNYNNKDNLVGAMIVAGWDPKHGGQVYGCPIGGTLASGEEKGWAVDGSGSTYIWGYLDAQWRPSMTQEEAKAFCVEALALAMARDGSSGGVIRLVAIDKTGAKESFVRGDAVPLFGDELLPPNATGLLAKKGVNGGVDGGDVKEIGVVGGSAQAAQAASGMVVG
jgi:20S proteasome subunit beta 1